MLWRSLAGHSDVLFMSFDGSEDGATFSGDIKHVFSEVLYMAKSLSTPV